MRWRAKIFQQIFKKNFWVVKKKLLLLAWKILISERRRQNNTPLALAALTHRWHARRKLVLRDQTFRCDSSFANQYWILLFFQSNYFKTHNVIQCLLYEIDKFDYLDYLCTCILLRQFQIFNVLNRQTTLAWPSRENISFSKCVNFKTNQPRSGMGNTWFFIISLHLTIFNHFCQV